MLSSFLVGGGRALLRAQGMGVGGPLRFSSVHLDYKSFLNRKEEMEQNVKNRRTGGDVGLVCDLYKQIGKETAALNQLRSEKASLAKKVGKELSVEDMRAEGMRVKEEIKVKGEKLEELQHLLYHHGGILPNWCHESCPIGPSDNNRVIGYFGSSSPSSSSSSSSPSPSSSSTDSFTAPKLAPLSPTPGKEESADSVVDYMEIGRRLDLFDFTSAAKVSGSHFCYFKNDAVFLEMALTQWALRTLVDMNFTPVMTPEVVRNSIMEGVGFHPRPKLGNNKEGEEGKVEEVAEEDEEEHQIYRLQGTGSSLIGTSEVSLIGMYADQIIPNEQLPVKLAGFSHCFRKETSGKGLSLYRLHQFSKVEMIVMTEGREEESERVLQEMVGVQRYLLEELGLRGQLLELATEDMGAPAYHKYDMELWMPSRSSYGEVTSASNCTDYQSRRLNIRQRDGLEGEDKKNQRKHPFVHIVNGTALAVPRVMISILEQCQDGQGRVVIPECLVPYMGKKYIDLQPINNQD